MRRRRGDSRCGWCRIFWVQEVFFKLEVYIQISGCWLKHDCVDLVLKQLFLLKFSCKSCHAFAIMPILA